MEAEEGRVKRPKDAAWAKDPAWWWVAGVSDCCGSNGRKGRRVEDLTTGIRNLDLLLNPPRSYLLLRGYSSYMFMCPDFLLMKLKDLCFSWLSMPSLFTQAFYFFTPAYFSLARNIFSLSFLMALFKLHVTWWVLPVDSGKGSRSQLHWGRGAGRSARCICIRP